MFLHCRELDSHRGAPLGAYNDMLRVLGNAAVEPSRCCVHCFTDSQAQLRQLLDAGFTVGITGYVTKADRGAELRGALRSLATERGGDAIAAQLVLETDAPYMRPPDSALRGSGFERGRDAEPAMTRAVCVAVASCLCVAPRVLAMATTRRAIELFWK